MWCLFYTKEAVTFTTTHLGTRQTCLKAQTFLTIAVFWVVTPCCLVGGYQRFRGTYRLHFQGRRCGNHLQGYVYRIHLCVALFVLSAIYIFNSHTTQALYLYNRRRFGTNMPSSGVVIVLATRKTFFLLWRDETLRAHVYAETLIVIVLATRKLFQFMTRWNTEDGMFMPKRRLI
jgi:hypothetical protein